jgi:hypothetical protein
VRLILSDQGRRDGRIVEALVVVFMSLTSFAENLPTCWRIESDASVDTG